MGAMRRYIAVGFDEDDGEADFEVSGTITNLSYESMTELRAMITVAIGTMEDMWRRAQQDKYPAAQAKP